MTSIYSIAQSASGMAIAACNAANSALKTGYTSLVTLQGMHSDILYAYNKTTKKVDVYQLSIQAPFVQLLISGGTDLNLFAWDQLRSFVLGNKSYLMGYEKTKGNFGFYEVREDFSLSKPYTFSNMRSWPTQNFSEVSPFVATGLMYVLGYDDAKGTVAIFSLDVISTSAGGVPPLNMLNVWYHQWAKGWEDFSFFQLGQSNFFFKINKAKLNVNIDHILDNPAAGTVEIGSYLQNQLPNALDVTLACIIPWADGEPYLATYDGKTYALNVYKIHADCQGWTQLNTATVMASTQMISYRIGNQSFVLLYS
jgi:hypothetical protein